MPADVPSNLAWRRIDLHLHTPASTDYQQPDISPLDILHQAEARGLDMIAFTDHNSVRGYAELWREIEDLELLEYLGRIEPKERDRLQEYRRLLDKIVLLPGFEFTATFGFHILGIFPLRTSVRMMEHLLLTLGVPEEKFGSSEVGATTDVIRAYRILSEHGALVIGAHVNSTNGVAMQGLRFGGQTKIAYTQDPNLHALEVTDLSTPSNRRSTARFFNGTKAEYPRRMHCIQGSDAHRLELDPQRDVNLGIGDRATEVLLPDVSFNALKDLFASQDFDRIRPYVPKTPLDDVQTARAEGNTLVQAFHERASTKRTGMTPLLQDIVAFANTNGGIVYVGASPLERRPIAGIADVPAVSQAVSHEIAQRISPVPPLTIDVLSSREKSVLAIHVAPGSERPYALEPGAVLVRRNGESTSASRDEIVAMIRGHVPSEPVSPQPEAAAEATAAPIPSSAPPTKSNGHSRRVTKQPLRKMAVDEAKPTEPTEVAAANGTGPETETTLPEDETGSDIAPVNGVEIVGQEETDDGIHYTLRDLRNRETTPDVTRDCPRRLWRYAIREHEEHQDDEAHIHWQGDLGYWRGYRPRGGMQRYNLAVRHAGELRIFYGVTEDGMPPIWREIIPGLSVAAEK